MKVASTNDVLAKVAINKSLLKEYSNSEYSRIVYLRDNSEFQIQIFNPYSYTIGADITIDNKSLGNRLIIKPGQRIWLERYFNEPRKFLFSTYEVSGTNREVKEAIANNGEINIRFYKEQQYFYNNTIYYNNAYDFNNYKLYNEYNTSITGASNYCNRELTTFGLDATLKSDVCASVDSHATTLGIDDVKPISCRLNKTIETGRVEKGSHSDQQFETTYINFESWSFHNETIKLLPESQKPIFKNDLQKQYCSNCGRKLNQKYKYCPYCGAKVDFCPNNDKSYVIEKCPHCGRNVRSTMRECPHCGEILR